MTVAVNEEGGRHHSGVDLAHQKLHLVVPKRTNRGLGLRYRLSEWGHVQVIHNSRISFNGRYRQWFPSQQFSQARSF